MNRSIFDLTIGEERMERLDIIGLGQQQAWRTSGLRVSAQGERGPLLRALEAMNAKDEGSYYFEVSLSSTKALVTHGYIGAFHEAGAGVYIICKHEHVSQRSVRLLRNWENGRDTTFRSTGISRAGRRIWNSTTVLMQRSTLSSDHFYRDKYVVELDLDVIRDWSSLYISIGEQMFGELGYAGSSADGLHDVLAGLRRRGASIRFILKNMEVADGHLEADARIGARMYWRVCNRDEAPADMDRLDSEASALQSFVAGLLQDGCEVATF